MRKALSEIFYLLVNFAAFLARSTFAFLDSDNPVSYCCEILKSAYPVFDIILFKLFKKFCEIYVF